ncbi:MAG: porin [Thauera sp.]|nr:porin [Thauera sp.]
MQKRFIALAIAGLISGPALAQSNVTVYGLVDMGYAYRGDNIVDGVKNRSGIDSGQAAGSRLGFRGVEDLGNGLKAGFLLEQGLFADTGAGRADGNFSRQSYLYLAHDAAGTVQLGRVYAPQDSFISGFDPFAGGTVAQVGNIWSLREIRYNNTIKYISPSFSGFNVTAAYSMSIGTNQSGASAPATDQVNERLGNENDIRGWAISPMYQNGPLKVGASFQQRKTHDPLAANTDRNKRTTWDLGASYDFGVAKLSAMYGQGRDKDADAIAGAEAKIRQYFIGATVPVFTNGAILASYGHSKNTADGANDATATQWAVGYNHALSKRTGLYAAYSDISNKDGLTVAGVDQGLKAAVGDASYSGTGYQRGFQVGIKHAF